MLKDVEKVMGWLVTTNTDCNEGRGKQIPLYFTLKESTAIRMGKGKYIQGGDCPVEKDKFLRYEDDLYVRAIVHEGSAEDTKAEKKKEEMNDLRIELGSDFERIYSTIKEDLEKKND